MRTKSIAAIGDIRPGGAPMLIQGVNRRWSMLRLTSNAYPSSVRNPSVPTSSPAPEAMRRPPKAIATSPPPLTRNPRAALYCIGENVGST